MSREVYEQLLHDEIECKSYCRVPNYPHGNLLLHLDLVSKYCEMETKINKRTMEYALAHKEPSAFHFLPEIHKATLEGRPITAGHSSTLSELSRRLCFILNTEVKKIPAITVDSRQASSTGVGKNPVSTELLVHDLRLGKNVSLNRSQRRNQNISKQLSRNFPRSRRVLVTNLGTNNVHLLRLSWETNLQANNRNCHRNCGCPSIREPTCIPQIQNAISSNKRYHHQSQVHKLWTCYRSIKGKFG